MRLTVVGRVRLQALPTRCRIQSLGTRRTLQRLSAAARRVALPTQSASKGFIGAALTWGRWCRWRLHATHTTGAKAADVDPKCRVGRLNVLGWAKAAANRGKRFTVGQALDPVFQLNRWQHTVMNQEVIGEVVNRQKSVTDQTQRGIVHQAPGVPGHAGRRPLLNQGQHQNVRAKYVLRVKVLGVFELLDSHPQIVHRAAYFFDQPAR